MSAGKMHFTRSSAQGWDTRAPGADKVLLVADEYKLTSTSDTEWLTPHIQSFPVNATAVSDVDRISFEVRPSRRLCACC